MVEKSYAWKEGAELEEHSRRKHKIVRQYFARYLAVRCQLPQQSRFRIAIVDGFCGAGTYQCGAPGSPLIFIEELRLATEVFNVKRASEGMSPLDIECLLIFNDFDPDAVEILKGRVAPLIAATKETTPRLHLKVECFNTKFEAAYPSIKQLIERGGYRNVIFNLDQCGTSHVEHQTIVDICKSFTSAEIFYTFMITSLLAFLQKKDRARLSKQMRPFGLAEDGLADLDGVMNNKEWLGAAERIVFDAFNRCADYVSPFSINNPDGWRYWFIHFANNYRARQEYNNVLHDNATTQAHFGRSGLNMLAYDPSHDGALYLFDPPGREDAKQQLHEDIPRLVTNFGDAVPIGEFYSSIYNATPAHTDDVHAVMIDNPDLQIVTEQGGERRRSNTIRPTDILRVKRQRSFPIFFGSEQKRG
ncbi:three-Cys-motif partner protein TcmP [Bradyrhizobium sp. SZCCHNPS2010]|uniref:three-Cys-motif partner protein TcmP n=1 Tax=Bradyrhizobium sp. SZCCHNPS2010 TaxID=3057333 RepID=UPI00291611D0|nr:three-Cys-motif partner protein TcmP [Bradyrhizobium sp. SZCCHNPS2010]